MKFLTQKLKYAAAVPVVLAIQAHAALPESVKTSLQGAQADGMEVGWLVVGILAAIFVIKIVKRFL